MLPGTNCGVVTNGAECAVPNNRNYSNPFVTWHHVIGHPVIDCPTDRWQREDEHCEPSAVNRLLLPGTNCAIAHPSSNGAVSEVGAATDRIYSNPLRPNTVVGESLCYLAPSDRAPSD
jgi:hypothetical protein